MTKKTDKIEKERQELCQLLSDINESRKRHIKFVKKDLAALEFNRLSSRVFNETGPTIFSPWKKTLPPASSDQTFNPSESKEGEQLKGPTNS